MSLEFVQSSSVEIRCSPRRTENLNGLKKFRSSKLHNAVDLQSVQWHMNAVGSCQNILRRYQRSTATESSINILFVVKRRFVVQQGHPRLRSDFRHKSSNYSVADRFATARVIDKPEIFVTRERILIRKVRGSKLSLRCA